jgi:hypothetical protein
VSIFNFVIGQPTDRPLPPLRLKRLLLLLLLLLRMSASESSRERGKRRYILFSLSYFCAHFLFAALWVLALDPWPFFFFLGRASSSWGSWPLYFLFYFFLVCRQKKPKSQKGEMSKRQ